jgi:hypothetical protein
MDPVPSPRVECDQIPAVEGPGLNGFNGVEATDQRFRQYGQARHIGSRSVLDGDDADLDSFIEPPTLADRADIDVAMVEALRHAIDSDQGRAALVWKTPDQMQFGDERRSGGSGPLTPVSTPLSVAPATDTAMVEVLTNTIDLDPGGPGA